MEKTENKLIRAYSWSFLSDGILISSISLFVLSSGGSAAEGAFLAGIFNLPWLLISIFSGNIIDKYCPFKILYTSNVFRIIILSAILSINFLGFYNFSVLIFLFFLLGSCDVFYENTLPTIAPKIFPKNLKDFNRRFEFFSKFLRMIVGKAIGPVLISISPSLTFLICSILFFVTVLNIYSMPSIEIKKESTIEEGIRPAFRWITEHKYFLKLIGMSSINNALFASLIAFLPTHLKINLNESNFHSGLTLSMMGLGYILGAKYLSVISTFNLRQVYISTATGISFAVLSIGFSQQIFVIHISMIFFGFAMSIRNITNWTHMQKIIPQNIIGRVTALQRTCGWGACSIGPLLGSFSIKYTGMQASLIYLGYLSILGFCISLTMFKDSLNDSIASNT